MAKETFSHEDLEDLMQPGERPDWVGSDNSFIMPNTRNLPSTGDRRVDDILFQEEMRVGNRMMNNRRPTTGHKGDTAHHPSRRVDRPSFGL